MLLLMFKITSRKLHHQFKIPFYFKLLIMKNSKENSQNKPHNITQKEYNYIFMDFCYKMNSQHFFTKYFHYAVSVVSMVITIFIYLILPDIGVINQNFIILEPALGVCFILYIIFIMIQICLGAIKGVGFQLKIQTFTYINIFFVLASYSLLHQSIEQKLLPTSISLTILFVSLAATFIIGIFFGQEAYSDNLIDKQPLPICLKLLSFPLLLNVYSLQIETYKNSLLLIMLINNTLIRFSLFNGQGRKIRELEYYLSKISASLNLFYSINLLIINLLKVNKEQIGYVYIFCTIFLIILYECLDYYTDQMPILPQNFFTNDSLISYEQLTKYCQYVASQVSELLDISNKNIQFSDTCIGPIYYQHIKKCNNISCQLSHQFNIMDFKVLNSKKQIPYKSMCQKICRLMENKLQILIDQEPQNIGLKMVLIRFYAITGFNKFKIFKLITEVEVLEPSFRQKIQLYQVKKALSDFEVVQALQNIKIDNFLQLYTKNINNVLNTITDFWTLMMEQKVDFSKIVSTSQKIYPMMSKMDQQFNEAVIMETYSTVKIMEIYAQFSRWILQDHQKTISVKDYITLLQKKFQQISQMNYIAADCEKALIAISLTSKKLGQISMVNTQACNLFLYDRSQMENFNINRFMPKLFSKNHDDFLTTFIKNPNKKVNTDVRNTFGKNKYGYVFPIYLQLKKSLTTVGDDLIFITSIQYSHCQQSPIIVLCDDQGNIIDFSTTFEFLFMKKNKRNNEQNQQTIKNIQDIIPDFYSMYQLHENQGKKFNQVFDNPFLGIIQIIFSVSKLSFPNDKDAGYIVRGQRYKEQTKINIFRHLNITKSLIESDMYDKNLEGYILGYNSKKNSYITSSNLQKFSGKQIKSYFTIPYIKIQEITGALFGDIKNEQKDYEGDIKTIRWCFDHYERAQQPQSFITESQTDHFHLQNNKKLSQMRQQFTHSQKQNYGFIKYTKINNILSVIIIVLLVALFTQQTLKIQKRNININQIQSINKFRELLSEYIVYLEIEQQFAKTAYTTKYKQQIIEKMIEMNLRASIPQQQKQKAMQIIYLESDNKVQNLLQNETFILPEIKQAQLTSITIIKVLFFTFIIAKVLLNIIFIIAYRNRLREIFTFFLGLPQNEMKKCMDNCAFVANNIKHQNSLRKQDNSKNSKNTDDQQDQQHIKIKKFRNITLANEKLYYIKITITSILIIVLFSGITFYDIHQDQQFIDQYQTFQFMTTVIPESSVYLMKKYLQIYKGSVYGIDDSFKVEVQQIQIKSLKIKENYNIDFFKWLYDNPCNSMLNGSSLNCTTLLNGVLTDGVSKGLNYMLNRLQTIDRSTVNNNQMVQFTQLLYQNIKQIFLLEVQHLKTNILDKFGIRRFEIVIFMAVLILLAIIDYIFIKYGAHDLILKKIKSAENLLAIIPSQFSSIKKIKNGYEQI